jgi:hypothetical protein
MSSIFGYGTPAAPWLPTAAPRRSQPCRHPSAQFLNPIDPKRSTGENELIKKVITSIWGENRGCPRRTADLWRGPDIGMNSLATSQSRARQPTQSAHAYAKEVSRVVNRGFDVNLTANRPWRPRRVLSLTLHGDLVLNVARQREGGGRDLAPLFMLATKVGWDARPGFRVNGVHPPCTMKLFGKGANWRHGPTTQCNASVTVTDPGAPPVDG